LVSHFSALEPHTVTSRVTAFHSAMVGADEAGGGNFGGQPSAASSSFEASSIGTGLLPAPEHLPVSQIGPVPGQSETSPRE
jgi:hypothetical protein